MKLCLKAVCECGNIFDEIKIARLKIDESLKPYEIQIPKIIPSYCPKCGKCISSIKNNCIEYIGEVTSEELKVLLDNERIKGDK